VTFSFSKRT